MEPLSTQDHPDGLTIRRVPINSLHLDPANARAHGEENMEAIVASLQRFGQAEPLIVHGPTGRVIGGNGRLLAMKRLGWTECDVVLLDITEVQATALGIALNRTGELAEWDERALAQILQQLQREEALDGVGFDAGDIDALLAELEAEAEHEEVDDPGPRRDPRGPCHSHGRPLDPRRPPAALRRLDLRGGHGAAHGGGGRGVARHRSALPGGLRRHEPPRRSPPQGRAEGPPEARQRGREQALGRVRTTRINPGSRTSSSLAGATRT